MSNDNYLVIGGKRIDLTDEQIKTLGLSEEQKLNPFKRRTYGINYCYIETTGEVHSLNEVHCLKDKQRYNVANYCTNEKLMQQRSLFETLNRLLWRFSMENDGDTVNTKAKHEVYEIAYDSCNKIYVVESSSNDLYFTGETRFFSKEIAQKAIDEIVIPFMEQHPDFIW